MKVSDAKKKKRQMLRKALCELTEDVRTQHSFLISRYVSSFFSSLQHSDAVIIGGFAPLLNEPLWTLALQNWVEQLAFPDYREGEMAFYKTPYETLIDTENFGIKLKTPPTSARHVNPSHILVPGLGFSVEGRRLGRGKGFFDRYLKTVGAIKIGLCFECQVVADLPTEKHDVSVDYLVTEKGVTTCKENVR